MSDPLADVLLADDSPRPVRARVGTVTSDDPLEVALSGQGGLPASRVQAYGPIVIGDVVLVLQVDTDLVVIDKLIFGG